MKKTYETNMKVVMESKKSLLNLENKNILIKTIILIFTILSTMFIQIEAKEHEDDNNTIIPYKFYNSFIPVVGVNPTYGTLYGVAFSSGVTLGDINSTKMSTISASLTRTTKNQTMFVLKSVGYTNHNDWMFVEDGRYFISSQGTFGLGTTKTKDGRKQSSLEAEDGDLIDFDLYRFNLSMLKRIKPSFYAGLGYMYDQYAHIHDVEYEKGKDTSYSDYTQKHGFRMGKSIISGISFDVIYDTRDNVATPYTGMYAYGSFRYYPEFLGSDKKGSSVWLEFRDYISLDDNNPRKLLTFWTYYSAVTSGDLPYMDLPALGWDQFGRSGRGYTQGRFRGDSIYYGEMELRMPLNISKKHPDRYGYTLFANITSTSDDDRGIDLFDGFELGAGVGFRYLLNKKSRAYLSADFAIDENKKTSIFLNINEAF